MSDVTSRFVVEDEEKPFHKVFTEFQFHPLFTFLTSIFLSLCEKGTVSQ